MWNLIIPAVTTILDKVLPDAQAAADAKLKLLQIAQTGELAELAAVKELAVAQIEVNKIEAASPDLFRGGWRPGAGWSCVFGLIYQFFLMPLLPWVAAVFGFDVPPLPPIDNETLLTLLMGMLGLGGLRTFERVRGKA
jgi:hypothetical protein